MIDGIESQVPRVLVMVSTYNGAAFLEEQLQSIKAQEGVNVSIIVRDDGSSDGTQSVLEKWAGKDFSWYQRNNVGWRESFMQLLNDSSEYDYYAFADQDDVWLPDKLERAISCLRTLPEGPQLYFSNLTIWKNGKSEGLAKSPELKFDKYRCCVQCLSTGNTMVFNTVLADIIKSNPHPGYLLAHDYWIYQAGILLGSVYYDPQSRILYRQHGDNQVGVKRSLVWDLKRKLGDIAKFLRDHRRQREAEALLHCYGNLMDDQTRKIVRTVAYYRRNIIYRLRFLFSRRYVMDTSLRTLLLKFRVLAGRV